MGGKSKGWKRLRHMALLAGIMGISMTGVGFALYLAYEPYDPYVYRIAFLLTVDLQNNTFVFPAGIGVAPDLWNYHGLDRYAVGRAPIYTRDSSGLVFIESTAVRDYTIGDFFRIWGRTFNSTCVEYDRFYCSSSLQGFSLKMTVNAVENNDFQNYVVKDRDLIVIHYEANPS